MKPTKKQFLAYEAVRLSGRTNMFDINFVCQLAGSGLTREHCLYIYKHYDELKKEYEVR